MPFQKGNKINVGRSNANAGRKPKGYHQAKLMAKDMALAYIEASVKPVMHQYFQLAAGRMVNKWHEGKIVGQEFEADAPTTRHFVDKIIPDKVEKPQDNKPLMWNVELVGEQADDNGEIEINPEQKMIEFTFPAPDDTEKPK